MVPRAFKAILGQYAPQFVGYQPQDAGELLTFVLNGLHEEVRQGTTPQSSSVAALMGGDFASEFCCCICQHVTRKNDFFFFLPVPLPASNERLVKFSFVALDPARPVTKYASVVVFDSRPTPICVGMA